MSSPHRILYIPRERKRVKKSFRKYFLRIGVAAGVVIFIGGAIVLVRYPALQVRAIEIQGGEASRLEEIRTRISSFLEGNSALIIPRRFIGAVSSNWLEMGLEDSFPWIAEVQVEKRFPDRLEISFTERKLFGVFCNDLARSLASSSCPRDNLCEACAFIDADGVLYESAPSTEGALITKIKSDIPEVSIGMKALDSEVILWMRAFGEGLRQMFGLGAVAFELKTAIPEEVRVTTTQGFSLIIDRGADMMDIFKILRRVLDEEIGVERPRLEYVDLRFGNKVFYKLRE